MVVTLTNDHLALLGLLIYLVILGYFLYYIGHADGYKKRNDELDKHKFDFEKENKP